MASSPARFFASTSPTGGSNGSCSCIQRVAFVGARRGVFPESSSGISPTAGRISSMKQVGISPLSLSSSSPLNDRGTCHYHHANQNIKRRRRLFLWEDDHQQECEGRNVGLTRSLELEEDNHNREESTSLSYADGTMGGPQTINQDDSKLHARFGSKETRDSTPKETSTQQLPSILLLNLVAILWGSQHSVIKTVVTDSDVASFTFLRFTIAALCALPYLPGLPSEWMAVFHRNDGKKKKDSSDINANGSLPSSSVNTDSISSTYMYIMPTEIQTAWRWGLEMGCWMFLGFALQAIGLLTTTAQRSGFLLYLNVKFVPFFAYIGMQRQISAATWLSALAAFSGTALLALDGQASVGLNVGDIWSVLAAMASAMYILRLEEAALRVPKASQLNAASLFVVATLSGLWVLMQQFNSYHATGNTDAMSFSPTELLNTIQGHPLELLYLGAVSTALSNFLQAKAQKVVAAERASIIYSLDPVYGALFSYIILGETLGGIQSYLGATMIFAAAASNSLLEFGKEE